MAKSVEERNHQEWLGYIQPVGLVVSIPALLAAQCHINKNNAPDQQRFLGILPREGDEVVPRIDSFRTFVIEVLSWRDSDLIDVPIDGLPEQFAGLEIVLPEYNETLRPTHVVPNSNPPESSSDTSPWMMLVQEIGMGVPLDKPDDSDSRRWQASPHAKFERLLKETKVSIGLLTNGASIRLVYAPRTETSGYLTFDIDQMTTVAGRPIFAALHMLLCDEQLFSVEPSRCLPAILANSRKYQNAVSTKLSEQVLAALFELLRGLQSANDQRGGDLLRETLARNPQQVYHGLLTVLMRMVFILYAEDRGLLSTDEVYTNHYSISGLFDRLRSDAGRYPDTMDQRFGAWAQLLTLFRIIHEGCQHRDFVIPARRGYLFDPERYPFLEGLGAGDSGIGDTHQEKENHGGSIVSGSEGLADGDGSDRAMLSGNQIVSERGDLWIDQPDSSGSKFDSSQHRGGTRAGEERVPSVSPDGSRELSGSRNTPDDRTTSRDSFGAKTSSLTPTDGPARQDAEQTSAGAGRLGTGGSGLGVGEDHTQTSKPTPKPQPQIPRISDGVVYRVLEDLLILDGERLSYRTLDVEQIGSVYEAIMGFELEVAQGRSIAVKATKSHGAPATVNLEALLAVKPSDRTKRLQEWTDQKLNAESTKAIKAAESVEDLLAALGKKIATRVTPNVVPAGAMIFQPSDERRRSGSHYTPRSLTEPIVRTTLEPILKQLLVVSPEVVESAEKLKARIARLKNYNKPLDMQLRRIQRQIQRAEQAAEKGVPHPDQILDLKVCDPAMGSGAFLVESCRQLGAELEKAWHAHDAVPTDIPPDETELLYAQRQVAQRCLYGVDKNVMAVDLAKLSLWLVTLAKDHAFTFLDHSLRHGDSLVGLTREQIIGFHWDKDKYKTLLTERIQKRLDQATQARVKILTAREDVPYRDQQQRMALAEEAISGIRLLGDACVSAFFAGKKKKDRQDRVDQLFGIASAYVESLKDGKMDFSLHGSLQTAALTLHMPPNSLHPFHWEIEFPEVFSRDNGGFDAFVGNPPFLGGSYIWPTLGGEYRDFIKEVHSDTGGKSVDLVAHFFRQCFMLLRGSGTFSLIATNTIAQGNTRDAGLRAMCRMGGTIYSASTRFRWPGEAAVIVSVISMAKGRVSTVSTLNGKVVPGINSLLMPIANEIDPHRLTVNAGKSFTGHKTLGMGFVFDDSDSKGLSIPLSELNRLSNCEHNAKQIRPYLGGEEINTSPTHANHRFVIDLNRFSLEEAGEWPDLLAILRERVFPERSKLGGYSVAEKRREQWWKYGTYAAALQKSISSIPRFMARSQVSDHHSIAFLPADMFVSHGVVAFPLHTFTDFAVLQSRPHEFWARFFGSSMKDDLRYTATECFETFPFPPNVEIDANLEVAGCKYYRFRERLMVQSEEGLTKTYNRFHSPDERDEGILELRRLHGLMDEAVLRAYDWNDLAESARCEFLLDYEEEEDDESPATGKRSNKKKPYRYRWPDDFRDEVLARLLELNEQRHKEELLAGEVAAAAEKKAKAATKAAAKKKTAPETVNSDLFPSLEREEALVVMSVAAWGKPISRNALENMLILMLNNQHRVCMARSGPPQKSKIKVVVGLNGLLAYCEAQNWIETISGPAQHSYKPGKADSPIGPLKARYKKAIEEVKLIFEQAKLEGKVIETKEVLDATENFVLTG